ncbi:MAG: hypothetical protein J0H35_11740 [Rhodospirillales bacterium]|nr:hypothetical protein [Rhodospirillales bacterium]
MFSTVQRLQGTDDPSNGEGASGFPSGPAPDPAEDLPYRVELWQEDRQAVELVLAITSSASIGYAAFYAASREHPERRVSLRLRGRFISRWDPLAH